MLLGHNCELCLISHRFGSPDELIRAEVPSCRGVSLNQERRTVRYLADPEFLNFYASADIRWPWCYAGAEEDTLEIVPQMVVVGH